MNPAATRIVVQGLAAVMAIALGLLIYDHWIAPPTLRVGVVDLNAVYREKEAEFTRRITEARSDADRDQAMQAAREFAQQLPQALESLPQECQCLVLLSTAIITPAPITQDLTPRLRQKVGLSH